MAISAQIILYAGNYKILKLITYSFKAAPISEISKGVRQYNTISLLIFFRALINTSKYIKVIFQ